MGSKTDGASKPVENRIEIAVKEANSNDFINSGTSFPQTLVNTYFDTNLSIKTGILNFSHGGDNISLTSGMLTSWDSPDKKGMPYIDDAYRRRSLTLLNGNKTFDLGESKLNIKVFGVYAKTDDEKKGADITYLNPEAKLTIKSSHFFGAGGIVGKGVTDNQAYLFGGYKDFRINFGTYAYGFDGSQPHFRIAPSYDFHLDKKSNLQVFGSAQTAKVEGDGMELRAGATYKTKFHDCEVRGNFITNNKTASNIENININVDKPIEVCKTLSGIISTFVGVSGQFKTDKTPHPEVKPVYGLALKVNIFDSKNHKKGVAVE